MVKSSIETLEDNRVKMTIEVEASELDLAINDAFKSLSKQVRLPGFRPGKVPRKVLEAHFGRDVARGQAIEESVPNYFLEAAADHEVDFISAPEYDVTGGLEEGPLQFDATVQVRPVINVGGYQSLKIEIPSPKVSDEDIDAQADQVRGQFGELEEVERPAETGDRVTIDINGTYDGEEVEGLTAADYLYEVGSGFVVSELDENLEGANAGDTLEFNAEHPDPDQDGELSFSIAVKQVQAMKLPELDDAFVKDATEFETVEAFKADIASTLGATKVQQANNALQAKTGEALGQLVEDDVPDALIDSEVNDRINQLAYQLQSQGMDFAQYLQITGSSIDDMRDQLREPAVDAVRVDLALRSVAAAEGLEATDAELDEEFELIATQMNSNAADVKEQIHSANQMVAIRSDLAKRKAVDWLLEQVEVVDEDGNAVDRADLEMDEEHDHDHSHDHAHDHDHGDEEE